MDIEVIYLHVSAKAEPHAPNPDHYRKWSERFAQTYSTFTAGCPHRLTVVSCGGPMDAYGQNLFYDQNMLQYDGHGWDCGAHQWAGSESNADFVLCLSTPAYFWRNDWLLPFAQAFEKYGPGLYGAQSSYERAPHIRTCFHAYNPDLMRQYPHIVNSRRDAEDFETGLWNRNRNLTTWALFNNYRAWLVAGDGNVYRPSEWRNPPNIFRRGDQSNCLIWDSHTDIYRNADANTKRQLEHAANTLTI